MHRPVIPEAEAFRQGYPGSAACLPLHQIPAQRGASAPLGRDDGWKQTLCRLSAVPDGTEMAS